MKFLNRWEFKSGRMWRRYMITRSCAVGEATLMGGSIVLWHAKRQTLWLPTAPTPIIEPRFEWFIENQVAIRVGDPVPDKFPHGWTRPPDPPIRHIPKTFKSIYNPPSWQVEPEAEDGPEWNQTNPLWLSKVSRTSTSSVDVWWASL